MSFVAASVTVGLGATQAIIGGIKSHKAQKNLENLKTPVYTPNKAVSDYYQTALNRYNTDPYNSQYYQQAEKQAQQGLATGISALGDRRSATGNIGALVGNEQNQLQNAGVKAENLRNQEFGALGQATNMKAADDRQAFQYNEEAPYEKQYNLLEAKAGGANQMENAGLTNAFQGIQGYTQQQQQQKYFKALQGMSGGRGNSGSSNTSPIAGGTAGPNYGQYLSSMFGLGGISF